ncbi:MAG: hypothetical protein JJ896_00435 [Rhodothermales bacterium]|nr:hypothetical protein [Rhodothermales bacterium]MBO6778093.1 hypothetical protein [Rhodothermales bacterium]
MRALILFLVLAGCSAPEQKAPSFEPDPVTAEQEAARLALLPAESVAVIDGFREQVAAVRTSDDFDALFERALRMTGDLIPADSLDPFTGYSYRFQGNDLGLPGLSPSCVAECTEATLSMERDDWDRIAQATPDSLDDAFVALLFDHWGHPQVYQGQITGWPAFFTRTWDYGGYSMLGSGAHEALWSELTGRDWQGRFTPHLDQMRQVLTGDMISAQCYGLPGDAVSAELNRIRATSGIDTDLEGAINQRIQDISEGAVEVDCQTTMDCACISG